LLFRWHVAPCGKYSLTNPAEGCCALTHRGERHMRELNGGSTPKDE
jgi:hypothetical protein